MMMIVFNSLTPLPVASLELKKDSTYPLKQNYTHHLQSTKDTAYEHPDSTTLLPTVNTIAWGIFCGAKYTHHTFIPIMKHH